MRRQGICAAALLAVTLGIMLFLPQRHYLHITYQKTGELICQRAAEPGDRLELQLTHSFEHVPWNEYYTVTEDLTFNLDALAVGGLRRRDPGGDGRAHPGGGWPRLDGGDQQRV